MTVEQLDAALEAVGGAVEKLRANLLWEAPVEDPKAVLTALVGSWERLDSAARTRQYPTAWGGERAAITAAMRADDAHGGVFRAARHVMPLPAEVTALPRREPGTSGRV